MTDQRIGQLAYMALIAEVEATPKPGLVDRLGSGAHRDMDIHTFYRSASALCPHFVRFAEMGRQTGSIRELFAALRSGGIEAEQDMFSATDGVNTHKGALFSIGLFCGAAGYLAGRGIPLTTDVLCGIIKEMTRGIVAREYAGLEAKQTLTKGERMYLAYGVTGVRGEAEQGFPCVTGIGLPTLRRLLEEGQRSVNDSMLCTLVTLMANVYDTNILSRHDMETAQAVRARASQILDSGCLRADIADFDRELTQGYISPGGAADLLAVTVFLHSLELDTDVVVEKQEI